MIYGAHIMAAPAPAPAPAPPEASPMSPSHRPLPSCKPKRLLPYAELAAGAGLLVWTCVRFRVATLLCGLLLGCSFAMYRLKFPNDSWTFVRKRRHVILFWVLSLTYMLILPSSMLWLGLLVITTCKLLQSLSLYVYFCRRIRRVCRDKMDKAQREYRFVIDVCRTESATSKLWRSSPGIYRVYTIAKRTNSLEGKQNLFRRAQAICRGSVPVSPFKSLSPKRLSGAAPVRDSAHASHSIDFAALSEKIPSARGHLEPYVTDGLLTRASFMRYMDDMAESRTLLIETVRAYNNLLDGLNHVLDGIMLVVSIFVIMLVMGANILQNGNTILGFILGFSFIFGSAGSEFFTAVVYVLFTRRYEIGDKIAIDGRKGLFTVVDFTSTHTSLKLPNDTLQSWPHSELRGAKISICSAARTITHEITFKVPFSFCDFEGLARALRRAGGAYRRVEVLRTSLRQEGFLNEAAAYVEMDADWSVPYQVAKQRDALIAAAHSFFRHESAPPAPHHVPEPVVRGDARPH